MAGGDPNVIKGGHGKKNALVHSRCVQVRCKDVVANGLSLLSSKSMGGEIPLVLIPAGRSVVSMWMEVPTGVYCLMQKFGKDIGPATPGWHLFPAWYRIAYVVTQQSVCYDAPVLSCPTADDVRVSVDVTLVFNITDPGSFIYRLGAKNFDEFLSGTVDEAIRMLVRKETHKTVYALRGERADLLLKMLNDKFSNAGVAFQDCKVTSVWLPDSLANCLEITTKLGKGMDVRVTECAYDFLNIQLASEMQIEGIRRAQEQTLVAEAGKKRQAELQFEQRSVKAEEEGEVTMILERGKIEVKMLTTQTDLDRTKQRLETWRVSTINDKETSTDAMRVQADLDCEKEVIRASWREEEMIARATITKCEAGVEKDAIASLAAKREHDLLLREKSILEKLADKGSFNLIGTSGDAMVGAVLRGSLSEKPA